MIKARVRGRVFTVHELRVVRSLSVCRRQHVRVLSHARDMRSCACADTFTAPGALDAVTILPALILSSN
jgi:hypothetical protein